MQLPGSDSKCEILSCFVLPTDDNTTKPADAMITKELTTVFLRDLNRLQKELNAYSNEAVMWQKHPGISNTAGNLALHIAGNLQHFIGAVLSNSGYVRNREAEFNSDHIPLSELTAEISAAAKAIETTLPMLDAEALDAIYPIEVLKKPMTTRFFLIHLQGHLNYHLGQVSYHRRLLNGG